MQIKRLRLSSDSDHETAPPSAVEVILPEVEDFPILDLVVDPVGGHVYWHTVRSLDLAQLDGEQIRNIHREEDDMVKHIVSIAIDSEERMLYWLLRGRNGFQLMRRSLVEMPSSAAAATRPTTSQHVMDFTLEHG